MPASHYRAGGIQNFLAQESHSENFARQRRHLANDIKAIGKTCVVFTKMWGDYPSFEKNISRFHILRRLATTSQRIRAPSHFEAKFGAISHSPLK